MDRAGGARQQRRQNLYLGLYFWNNGSPELMLFKRISGNWTQLGAAPVRRAGGGHPVARSPRRLDAHLLQNGVARITATDTSLTRGAPGIMAYGTRTGRQLGRRTAHGPGTPYTVGGTVRPGHGGTVVLEDNGGNDLSVTANGAFTFSTPLAGGAAYNVTVKTNPSGRPAPWPTAPGTVGAANVTSVAVTCATVRPGDRLG